MVLISIYQNMTEFTVWLYFHGNASSVVSSCPSPTKIGKFWPIHCSQSLAHKSSSLGMGLWVTSLKQNFKLQTHEFTWQNSCIPPHPWMGKVSGRTISTTKIQPQNKIYTHKSNTFRWGHSACSIVIKKTLDTTPKEAAGGREKNMQGAGGQGVHQNLPVLHPIIQHLFWTGFVAISWMIKMMVTQIRI